MHGVVGARDQEPLKIAHFSDLAPTARKMAVSVMDYDVMDSDDDARPQRKYLPEAYRR